MADCQGNCDATPEKLPAESTYPLYDYAIKQGTVSFSQVAEGHYYQQKKHTTDETSRVAIERYYPRLVQAFSTAHGAITNSYFCDNIIAASVLTDKDEIHLINPIRKTGTLGIEELFFLCDSLQIEARQHLAGRDRRICMERIYSILTFLLNLMDTEEDKNSKKTESRTNRGRTTQALALLKEELDRVEQYYKQRAQGNAQIDYFLGMSWGIIALSAVVIGYVFFLSGKPPVFTDDPLLGSLVFGSMGAIVSVLSRMTFGGLDLNYRAGPKHLKLLGSIRPIIGAVFGVAFYILLMAHLIPAITLPSNVQPFYFYASIAFLAGFIERWAQDMLVGTGDRLKTSADKETKPIKKEEPTKTSVLPK